MNNTGTQPLPPGPRALVTIGVMAASLMQALDQTIANVALPHMQASLGANQESVSWVLTSYIVMAAIATPVTGWLASRYGRRKLFVFSTIGFTIASMACGLAMNLVQMVLFRAIQGMFGAFLVPLSQAVMYDINPREKHTQAMTIWGLCVMMAPVVGPVFGGWLTDSFDWRWVFYINVPFGILSVTLMALLLPDGVRDNRKFDLMGFAMLSIALGAFQIMLDRGTQQGWLDSWEIWIEIGISICALWCFIIHSATSKNPLLPVAMFKDGTFSAALVIVALAMGVMIAGSALTAPFLQQLMGHSPTSAGMATAPRGFGMMLSMLLAGQLMRFIDGRLVIGGGLVLMAISLWMMSGFTLDMGSRLIYISGFFQGVGAGLISLSLNLLAFSTLSSAIRTEAAGLYSLARSLGGSVSISVMNAMIARNVQVSHSDLSQHISTTSIPWVQSSMVSGLGMPAQAVIQMLDNEINRQALLIAYVDDFYLMFWATLCVIPFVLIMRKPKHRGDISEAMAMAD